MNPSSMRVSFPSIISVISFSCSLIQLSALLYSVIDLNFKITVSSSYNYSIEYDVYKLNAFSFLLTNSIIFSLSSGSFKFLNPMFMLRTLTCKGSGLHPGWNVYTIIDGFLAFSKTYLKSYVPLIESTFPMFDL